MVQTAVALLQDLRRFARSPASVFNPGASLADTFHAEQRTGVVFPDEARASFILFDGQARSAWLRSEVRSLWWLEGGVPLLCQRRQFRCGSRNTGLFLCECCDDIKFKFWYDYSSSLCNLVTGPVSRNASLTITVDTCTTSPISFIEMIFAVVVLPLLFFRFF